MTLKKMTHAVIAELFPAVILLIKVLVPRKGLPTGWSLPFCKWDHVVFVLL